MRVFGLSLTTILVLLLAFFLGTKFPNAFAKLGKVAG